MFTSHCKTHSSEHPCSPDVRHAPVAMPNCQDIFMRRKPLRLCRLPLAAAHETLPLESINLHDNAILNDDRDLSVPQASNGVADLSKD